MSKGHIERSGIVRQVRWERELLSMLDSGVATIRARTSCGGLEKVGCPVRWAKVSLSSDSIERNLVANSWNPMLARISGHGREHKEDCS